MHLIQQVLFISVLSAVAYVFIKKSLSIYRNIMLGKAFNSNSSSSERMKNMLLVGLGQKKMFARPIAAIFHLFIYAAFVITQIELIEIVLDGILGQHRLLGNAMQGTSLAGLYNFTISFIEILSLLALIATFVFLSRRNLIKLPRFNMAELKGWPMKDANFILLGEIFLVTCIFTMNSADFALQARGNEHYHFTGNFVLSQYIASIWSGCSDTTIILFERLGWWGHIIGIFGFLVYLPFSKHLHILLAFPNTYFSRTEAKGYISNMPEITREIKYMMDPTQPAPEANPDMKFGARDVQDLTWKNLLDAYSCTECGRCTSACPANLTGKKLSPRKIMMDTRDRLEEVGKVIDAKGKWEDDGKKLLHDYITQEELSACTTCNACVEECPINISPLDIIVQLRRNLIMEESNAPAEWNNMFGNIETNGAPWKFSQQDRGNWANEM